MNKIKLARIKRGISQKELAERIGIKAPTLSDIEKSKQPRAETLYKVAKALNIDVEELIK